MWCNNHERVAKITGPDTAPIQSVSSLLMFARNSKLCLHIAQRDGLGLRCAEGSGLKTYFRYVFLQHT